MTKITSTKITEAIELCTLMHKEQKRKGVDIPFASHPISVGFILASLGYPENVVIAGILHDTLEDTTLTAHEIEIQFGKEVLQLVQSVTEDHLNESWFDKKDKYLLKVTRAGKFTCAISAADMLDNLRSMSRKINKNMNIWEYFSVSSIDVLNFYKKRLDIVKNYIDEVFKNEIENTIKFIELSVKK